MVIGARTELDRRRNLLAPSILTADLGRLADEIRAAEQAGADWIHLDVMDGHFVPNLTFGPHIVEAVRKSTNLPLDVHLMITEPEKYAPVFAGAGATIITMHQEACTHLNRQIAQLHELGVKAGVALNPATPVHMLEDIAADIDLVLVMTVNPGFGGQSFIEHSLDKVRRMRELLQRSGSKADLEVDGGISEVNIATVARAGANVFVVGSAVYNDRRSVRESIGVLRSALPGGE
jgi:ribulose-phosphate 3-epimerase